MSISNHGIAMMSVILNIPAIGYIDYSPVAVYGGCGIVGFVYWLRLKQYL